MDGERTATEAGIVSELALDTLGTDPLNAYSRLRARGTLVRAALPGVGTRWIAARYDHVKAVISDARLVNNIANVPGLGIREPIDRVRVAAGVPANYLQYLRAGLPGLDGTDHIRLRTLVSAAFTPRRIGAMRSRIENITNTLLGQLPNRAEQGVVDLLRHFAYPLPLTTICELVGVPEPDRDQWRGWSASLSSGTGGKALRMMVDYTYALIDQRRATPADDLISRLTRTQDEAQDRLSDTELVSLIVSLVVAGHETTAHLILNSVVALLAHPAQAQLVRNGDAPPEGAVDELMRWCSPVHVAFTRYARENMEIYGATVRKGEAVMPIIASANEDPEVFPDPEQLDVTRPQRPGRATHLGFGYGPHFCLGASLARLEVEIAVPELLRRYPTMALLVPPEVSEKVSARGAKRLTELSATL